MMRILHQLFRSRRASQSMVALVLSTLMICAPAHADNSPVRGTTFDHRHALLTTLLQKHVVSLHEGRVTNVNYATLVKDRAQLKSYLAQLSAVSADEFAKWSRAQRMAFLINAYNAFTLELMVQHYPVKSIKDIGGLLDNRWKRRFIPLLGRQVSLDEIEHDMLRRPSAYDDLRVHYAVNCASIGCPALRAEAFYADRLPEQLEEQAVRFLSDRTRNRVRDGRLEVSMIFKWFREDWERGLAGVDGKAPVSRTLECYFARYAKLLGDTPSEQAAVAAGQLPLAFLDYDWSINDTRAVPK
jgi:hypothetical protein